MEVTLEQIELVKDRTGASYKEAKEALEQANGNVVDAIIYIEENISSEYENSEKNGVSEVIDTLKKAVKKGNVNKIRIYKGDDLILNVPVNVGAVAAIVFPWGVVAGAVASAATKCKIELVKEDGTVVDINEKATDVVNTVKDKSGVIVDEIKEKGGDAFETAKEKGSQIFDSAKEKGGQLFENLKEKGGDFVESAKVAGTGLFEEAKERGAQVYANTKDKVSEYFKKSEETVMDVSDIDLEEESGMDGAEPSCCDDNADQ